LGTPRGAAKNGSSNTDAGSSPRGGAARATRRPPRVDGPRRGFASTSPRGARDPTSREGGLARGTREPRGRGDTVATTMVHCFELSNRRASSTWRARHAPRAGPSAREICVPTLLERFGNLFAMTLTRKSAAIPSAPAHRQTVCSCADLSRNC
jgi:hypothetical protein